jgi:hypothetical protein
MKSETKWIAVTAVVVVALIASLSLGVEPERLAKVIVAIGIVVALCVWTYRSANKKR